MNQRKMKENKKTTTPKNKNSDKRSNKKMFTN